MARVPIQQGNFVRQERERGPNFRAADNGGGIGGAIGAGLQQAGREVARFADAEREISDIRDEATTRERDNDFTGFSLEALHTGQSAYLNTKGRDALTSRPDVEKALKDKAAALLDQATNPRQRQMLERVINPRLQQALGAIASHENRETFTYQTREIEGRIDLGAATAGNSYLDPQAADANIATVSTEIERLGQLQGWPPEQIAAARAKTVSGIHRDIATRLSMEGEQGPAVAEAYLKRHEGAFTSDDAVATQGQIRIQERTLAAQQRAEAAEARRAKAEADATAKDRAEDVLRIVDAGGTVPGPQLSGAIAGLRGVKNADGLSFRLGKAGLQQALTIEYKSATPAEIQNRINELTPKVKAAGENVPPELALEVQHLSTLRDRASAELKSDPLSWGASRLGITVPPLDWNSPAMLKQRVDAGIAIARRTGVQPKFFTDEEAATMSASVATGDVGQQRAVIGNLAKLGSYAGSLAARQIAPNDPRLWGIVGLATLPDRHVSASLVTKALDGPGILKANPKLIDNTVADQQFNEAAAPALRLMPEASAGVLANAKAIFAASVAQQGFTDWASSRKAWAGAINSALGAYRDNGVQRGGLGVRGGATTILPEGVTQEEFDQKVNRADVGALMAGSNGVPVWTNGKPLTVGQVKEAQFVPVGNGRYRLQIGQGYVQKRGGGFYELDYSRIGR